MKLQGKSIRSKLIRLIMTISATSLILVLTVLFVYEILSYRQSTTRDLAVLGNMLAANSTAALAFDDEAAAREILASVRAEKSIIGACLYRADGRIFASYGVDSLRWDIPEEAGGEGFRMSGGRIEGFVPVVMSGKRIGTLYINRDTRDIDERLLLYGAIAGAVVLLSFIFTYFLSKRLERSVSNPIISLSDVATAVAENRDYSVRAINTSDGEIGLLTEALNSMLSTIQVQNNEIHRYTQELENRVEERTREMRTQKEFAEVVVNSSLVLIAVFDVDLRIIGFNQKCEEEFGLKREDVLNKKFEEAMPAIKGSLTYKSVKRALAGELIHNPMYRSSVTGFYYESFTIPLRNNNNEVYAVLMTAHNISKIVEASEELRLTNRELQRKNSDLEQFAYVASHDLQEPLRKIQVFSELTKMNYNNAELVQLYLGKVETAARRMSRLIQDVLQYSRLTHGEEAFTQVDLNEVLDIVKSDFDLLMTQKNVTINSVKLPVIRCNKLQFHQLFANLINNSIKFCEKDPVIDIDYRLTSDDESRVGYLANRSMQFIFKDNGIGFDPQYSDKLFNFFQRLHPREKYDGTGIGLALCKKIVENHGGTISAVSRPGEGTTFIITLPLEPAPLART
jgi:PAS domain S-box-containing protein